MRANRQDETVRILHRLGELGEPAAMPWILPFTVSGTEETRLAAVSAIESLSVGLRPRDVIWLDEYVRRWTPGLHTPSAWHRISAVDLSRDPFRQSAILAMASCHPNGFVRVAALAKLGAVGIRESTIPFLIIRLNDWVPAVRRTAEHLFRRACGNLDAVQLLPGLALLPWMRQTDLRNDLGAAASLLTKALDRRNAAYARRLAVASTDREVRREGYRALARCGELDREIVQIALIDSDPLIAGEVLDAALSLGTGMRSELCGQSLKSPHSSIRARAVREFGVGEAKHTTAFSPRLLFDRSASVREAARYVFRDLSSDKVLELGLEAIQHGAARQKAAALLGLAELGSRAGDIESVLATYRSDDSARVRASVLRCMAHVHGKLSAEQVMGGLRDASPRVARTVARLSVGMTRVPPIELWDAVVSAPEGHTRRYAFLILCRQGKWSSLEYILNARRLPDIEVRRLAEIELRRWFVRMNRSFVQPTDSQRAAILAELVRQQDALDPWWRNMIEFSLR
jgi:HEAT repeat protein